LCKAYPIGLFANPLDELISGNGVFFKTDAEIEERAVLVVADTEGRLIPDQPMGYDALNCKLQEMCEVIELLLYNTIYGFRRDAASTTVLEKGTEAALQLLNHVAGSRGAMIHYDTRGLGAHDLTVWRIGGAEISDADIKTHFSQSTVA
jgi:hypothetical protein